MWILTKKIVAYLAIQRGGIKPILVNELMERLILLVAGKR